MNIIVHVWVLLENRSEKLYVIIVALKPTLGNDDTRIMYYIISL